MNDVKAANKEADGITRAGLSAVYKREKLRGAIKEAMQDPAMKQAVTDYIFNGDPDAVSPLAEIRKANK